MGPQSSDTTEQTQLNWTESGQYLLEDLGGWCATVDVVAQGGYIRLATEQQQTTNHIILEGSILEIHLWDILNALYLWLPFSAILRSNHFYKSKLAKRALNN